MVTELFKHADCFKRLAAFASEETLDIGALDEVIVEVHLEWCKVAEYHVFVLDGQVLGKDVVGSADDELVDQCQELCKAFVSFLSIRIRTGRISTSQYWQLIFLAEVHACP